MGMIVLLEAMVAMPVHGPMTAIALSILMGTMVIIKGKSSQPETSEYFGHFRSFTYPNKVIYMNKSVKVYSTSWTILFIF